jgi:hypothetical protein
VEGFEESRIIGDLPSDEEPEILKNLSYKMKEWKEKRGVEMTEWNA